jgi:hypothetical protein
MKQAKITTGLLVGALLAACGGSSKDDVGGAPGPAPTPAPQPTSTDFNAYVKTLFAGFTGSAQDSAEPLPVETLTFTFTDSDETAFDSLIP